MYNEKFGLWSLGVVLQVGWAHPTDDVRVSMAI